MLGIVAWSGQGQFRLKRPLERSDEKKPMVSDSVGLTSAHPRPVFGVHRDQPLEAGLALKTFKRGLLLSYHPATITRMHLREEPRLAAQYCDQCGKRVATSARFCPNCGAEQEPVIVRVPIPNQLRFEVLKRDSQTCVYCGRRPPHVALEVDHVIPVSSGGRTEFSNLVTACQDCNRGKGANLVEDTEYQDYLLQRETEDALLEEQLNQYNNLTLGRIKLMAALDHAFWGYPVIADKENPLYIFLKNDYVKAWQGGKTLLMAMQETLGMLTIYPRDRTSPKFRMMVQRLEYATNSYNRIFPYRACYHQLYLQTQFEEVRELCGSALESIDDTLDSRDTLLWALGEENWHHPIEANLSFRPTNLRLEILGVLPRNELNDIEDN